MAHNSKIPDGSFDSNVPENISLRWYYPDQVRPAFKSFIFNARQGFRISPFKQRRPISAFQHPSIFIQ